MQEQPRKEVHYDREVWVNPTTESLRDSECLCLNCGNMRPDQPDNCHIAQALYQICIEEGVALTVTRCPAWEPEP